jgi:hypothetical protein
MNFGQTLLQNQDPVNDYYFGQKQILLNYEIVIFLSVIMNACDLKLPILLLIENSIK